VGWSVILAFHGSWVVLTSEFGENIGEEAFRNLVIVFYVGFLLFSALGAFLAWFAQKKQLWAIWLFVAYCVYRPIDYIWGIIGREHMDGITVDTTDWIKCFIITGVWLFLAGYAWYSRSCKSFQPATDNAA
jgi:hypothetical protein